MKTIVLLSIMFLSLVGLSQTSNERYQSYLNRCNTLYTTEIDQRGHILNGNTTWVEPNIEYSYSADPDDIVISSDYDRDPTHWTSRKIKITVKLCKPESYEIWLTGVVYYLKNGVKTPDPNLDYDKLLNNLETNINL
jgi:hypothetical protein